jgi:hypothetical protein
MCTEHHEASSGRNIGQKKERKKERNNCINVNEGGYCKMDFKEIMSVDLNCSWSVAASSEDGIEHTGFIIDRELVVGRLNCFRMTVPWS